MSHIFEGREKQFEAQFQHDEELRFKVHVRRDKLLGQWAAKRLGLTGAEAESYAKGIIMQDIEKPGEQAVIGKLSADFTARGIDMSEHRIRKHMDECLAEAQQLVMREVKR
jgi:hypothetical protein